MRCVTLFISHRCQRRTTCAFLFIFSSSTVEGCLGDLSCVHEHGHWGYEVRTGTLCVISISAAPAFLHVVERMVGDIYHAAPLRLELVMDRWIGGREIFGGPEGEAEVVYLS